VSGGVVLGSMNVVVADLLLGVAVELELCDCAWFVILITGE